MKKNNPKFKLKWKEVIVDNTSSSCEIRTEKLVCN
jgi:hypothetical protein